MNYVMAAVIGIIGGVTSGLFGVGGGVVMVPAMLFLLGSQVTDIKQAIGTSLAVIVPTAIVGSWQHNTRGNVIWPVVFTLIPTALIGGFAGAWLTTKIPADDLKKMFGGFLLLVGGKLLFFK
ncbi:MAG: sulfite exporter TauE/SafE family protein [Proteobacteria bacterium]|nr:sulfite exporter TauE/SafE family protein [Pseudomonadota bacterium]